MTSEYDIMIIGGGPSGLSAATAIVRQSHKTVLFDSGKYRNYLSKHVHTLPTWDHRDPAEFRAAARADFDRYGSITVENAEIETIKKRDDGVFEATSGGRTWTSKKVILATGVEDVFPDIPGYAECWVSAIFHCLYCHGWEEKGAASSGVLAVGDIATGVHALHMARQGLRMSEHVTIYTDGNEQLAKDLTAAIEAGAPAPMTVDSRKITKLAKGPERSQITLYFEDGDSRLEAFLAHKPKTALRGNLAQQLGVEITPMNTLKVNPPFNQTNIKGVFAAGDCSTPMQTVTSAIFSGGCTGAGAPLQLQAETYNQPGLF